ncbi:MAG: SprB repeat-containing protein [Lewinellaceae bacterium]|nr:SprB repeat-containing protein [Phaeodactylibacter sp.]MCB9036000.1 SprB repeat-containing protein [Lewinellaceae bacterium]
MKCALTVFNFLFSLLTALAADNGPSLPSAPVAPLSLDTIALDTTICVGDSVQLHLPLSGATGIQWQPAAFLSCNDCPDPVTEPLFGDQFFTVTGLDGQGAPFSYEYNVYLRNYLDFGLLPFSNSPVCEGDTLVFEPNVLGAQSYAWTGPNQAVFSTNPFPIIPDVSQADAGSYSLDLIDDLGCEAGATFDVQVFPSFTVNINATPASCNGLCNGSVSLAISGGTPPYLVSWDEGLNWSADTELAGLCTGTYAVWVMDENCLQKLEATIEEANPLGASFNISPPNCPGDDIFIEIFGFTGGAGSGQEYFYSIDGGLTFQTTFDVPWPIPASTASIIIADDAGCQSTYPINVVFPEPIHADIRVVNASCISLDDGSITISVSGGTPPYSFFFNNDLITTAVVSPIDTGVYYVEITDINGCSVEHEITISTNPIDAMPNDTVICAGEQVQLQAEAPGAVNVQWTPAAGLSSTNQLTTLASPTESITYVLTVEDDEGCLGTDSVQVAVLSGLPCREEWRDTLVIGQSGQWCSVASLFGSPIPYGITELGCGLGYVGPNVDSLGLCIDYRALEPGQDTLCLTICELLDTATCWEAWLYLTVTETLVRPGDTDSSGMADQYDLLNIGLGYGAAGPIRPNASLDWQGQPAPFWPQYTPASGINYRHIDTDGDGLISAADTLALSQNWGLAWEDGEGRPGSPPFQTNADGAPFYLQPDTLIEGATMQLPLILGSEETPAAGVYGLAFSLYFDEAVVQDGSAALLLADSWLGNPAQNLIYMQRLDDAAGRIDVGITRIDGLDAEGYGPIGDLFITIEDDILALNRGFGREAWFEIRNARLISYQEEPLAVDTPPSVSPVLTSLRDQPLSLKLRLSPNPAGSHFRLSGQLLQLEQVQLLNVIGQPVRSWRRPESGDLFSLQGIAPGLYLVKAQAGAGAGAWWLVVE